MDGCIRYVQPYIEPLHRQGSLKPTLDDLNSRHKWGFRLGHLYAGETTHEYTSNLHGDTVRTIGFT